MSLTYLLDTGWIIRHLRGSHEYTAAIATIGSQHLAISIVSLAELAEGVYRASDPAAARLAVDTFLLDKSRLDLTTAIADRFGRLRAELRRQNRLVGDMDLFIAATCLAHGLTLLTSNRKHFERIPGLSIISDPADL